jgi:hypothetical protein
MSRNYVELYEGHIDMKALYYNLEDNLMFDADGKTIIDIFRIISPNDLFLFKKNKEWMIVRGVSGDPVELIYPESPGIYGYHNISELEEY